jgi:hypothetical protein
MGYANLRGYGSGGPGGTVKPGSPDPFPGVTSPPARRLGYMAARAGAASLCRAATQISRLVVK